MYDIAIVGGGPVGVVAANLCGVFGLSAIVLEREADVYNLPRAAGLHDDAQRILHNAGVLDAIHPATRRMAGAEFVDASGHRIAGIEIPPDALMPSGYPPVLNIHQPSMERAIRSRLAAHPNVDLWSSHDVLCFDQVAGHLDLCARDRERDRDTRVAARWLVGCDGAASFVRKSCGIGWESLGYDREWLVVDVELRREVALPELCQQVCDPRRPTTIIPMPGRLRRWEFQLRPGETRAETEEPDRVWRLLSPWLAPGDGEIVRAVVYRFHATIAETFRHGRVFLAGDAAHQMPPFMGQGLCTGLRDVENLVWKIAMVERGQADDRLLDTYTAERRPFAMAMVEHSTNTGKLIDAYAEMARGGPEPPPELQRYAYGAAVALPQLAQGLLAIDDSPWVGRLLPHATDASGLALDDVVGPRWAVLSRRDPRPMMSRATEHWWDVLEARVIAVGEVDGLLGAILREDSVVVVRPDRAVYAVAPAAEVDQITERLSAQVASSLTRARRSRAG